MSMTVMTLTEGSYEVHVEGKSVIALGTTVTANNNSAC